MITQIHSRHVRLSFPISSCVERRNHQIRRSERNSNFSGETDAFDFHSSEKKKKKEKK